MAVVLAAGAVAFASEAASPAPSGAATHVVLIGFDGFDPAYLDQVETPNLDALAARGVHGVTESVMLPITTPSFTSIATGTWPDKNGTLTYYFDRATNTFRTGSPRSTMPSIADAVIDAGGTVGAAQYWAFNGHGAAYGNPTGLYTQPGGACSNMFDDAIAMLRREPVNSNGTMVTVPQIPTLLGVYCSHLDSIGHDEGAESPNLVPAMAELDAQVGRLLSTLDELGIADETTVIVTGDHGMSTYTQRNTLALNQALVDAGYRPQMLLLQGQTVPPEANVLVVPAAGRATSLYLVGDLSGDADALEEDAEVAAGVEGIGRIIDRDEQATLHMNPNFGDLVLESAPGWSTGVIPMAGPRGDHGSTEELDAAFFMAGAGVTYRAEPVRVCHVNVAPTIARLLAVPALADADGGPLDGSYDDIVGCPLGAPSEPPTTTTTTTTTTDPPTTATTTTPAPTTTRPSAPTTRPTDDPSVDGGTDQNTPPRAGAARAVRSRPAYVG
jgi:hypothetical protein